MTEQTRDPDTTKGAVEQDRREQPANVSLKDQLPHRTENPLVKSSDSDFPEPGNTPEHTGEPEGSAIADGDEACPRPET